MLVLSRKKDEKIVIGDSITLMVIEIRGDKVRLGIEAPRDVTVHREEVYDAIKRENARHQAGLIDSDGEQRCRGRNLNAGAEDRRSHRDNDYCANFRWRAVS